MNKWVVLLLGLGAISLIPIWRGAQHSRQEGITFWQLLKDSTRELDSHFGHPHYPYEEAKLQATEACRALRRNRE